MNKTNDLQDFDWDDSSAESFDLRQFLNKARANWVFIALSALLGLSLAYVYLYVAKPVYKTTAKVLIKEDDPTKSGAARSNMDMLQSLGMLNGTSNVDNELEILKSFNIVRQAVVNLGLYVSVSKKENKLKTTEYYGNNSPFLFQSVMTDERQYNSGGVGDYAFSIANGNTAVLLNTETHQKFFAALGKPIHLPGLDVTVQRNNKAKADDVNGDWLLHLVHLDKVTDDYLESVKSEIPNKQVSVISLAMEDALPKRSRDFLNEVINIYINSGIADRNAISDSTIAFIDGRLVGVTADLKDLEEEIQHFKQQNEIVDISAQAQAMLENAGAFSQTAVTQEVQLSVVNSLISFMQQTSKNPRLVPASLTVDNAALAPILSEYNKLLLERQRSLLSMTEENPVVQNIDVQLADLRSNIVTGLQNMRTAAQSGLSTIQKNSGSIESTLRTIPAKERTFLDYARQQSVKQELYLFLLQKREEAALSKSSTLSNVRIIEPARTITEPVKPKRKITLALGLLVGLLFPFGFMWVKALLSNKVETKKDIEDRTRIPIVGEIGHFPEGMDEHGFIVNNKNGRHPVVEQFRMLRSNLNYTLPQQASKVILITSTTPGEGKTFVSLNLAATFALTGKKTLVIGLDLRKPKLAQLLKMTNKKGLTHYLVGNASLEDIIHPIPGMEHLSVIVNGVIPPNPAELLMLPKTRELIGQLSQQFDYVILDTAPNVVADPAILSDYAAVTLYITRVGVTHKDSIEKLDITQQKGTLGKLNIVVNDIDFERERAYYSYYGYKGAYTYGYYEETRKKKSLWRRFRDKLPGLLG